MACKRCGWCCSHAVIPICGSKTTGPVLNEPGLYRGMWIWQDPVSKDYSLVIPCVCRHFRDADETNDACCLIYNARPESCKYQTCPPMVSHERCPE